MEFRQLFINMLLIASVIIGIFMFVIGTQANYNVVQPIVNNSKLAFYNQIQNNITAYYGQANASQTGFYSSPPSVDTGGLMLTTVVGAGQILSGTVQGIWDLMIGGEANILGIPPIFTMILNTLIIGVVVLLIWSLIRLGR